MRVHATGLSLLVRVRELSVHNIVIPRLLAVCSSWAICPGCACARCAALLALQHSVAAIKSQQLNKLPQRVQHVVFCRRGLRPPAATGWGMPRQALLI